MKKAKQWIVNPHYSRFAGTYSYQVTRPDGSLVKIVFMDHDSASDYIDAHRCTDCWRCSS